MLPVKSLAVKNRGEARGRDFPYAEMRREERRRIKLQRCFVRNRLAVKNEDETT